MFSVDKIDDLENYTLPYPFDALEPIINEQSLKQHYHGHMLVYIDKLKKLLLEYTVFSNLSLNDIIIRSYGDFETIGVYSTAAQIYAHILCWESLRTYGDTEKSQMSAALVHLIEKSYSSIEQFKSQLIEKSLRLFGNGWTWLVINENGELEIITTINAFNPLNIDSVTKVLMCIDLWEHAYYLQFYHQRDQYLQGIWQIINWKYVSNNLL